MLEVDVRLRKGHLPWRSVVLYTPPGESYWKTKKLMHRVLHELAKRHGIPRKQTRVVSHTAVRAGIYGYVQVFRGSGTPAERELFKRVRLEAAGIDLETVKSQEEEIEFPE